MTTCVLRSASPAKTKADAVVVGVLAHPKGVSLAAGADDVAAAYGRKLRPLLASLGHTGKVGETIKIPTSGVINAPVLVLVGLGETPDAEVVRRAAGCAARAVTNAASVAIALPADSTALVRATIEGWLLGGYRFTTYRSATASTDPAPSEVVVLSPNARKAEFVSAFDQAQVVAAAVIGARDWVNTPPNDLTPPLFADAVAGTAKAVSKAAGKGAKVTATVYDEHQLAELGCGGILAVGRSSAAPARLVELSYSPSDAVAHVALVGKGITFDSGGLSIKPAGSMGEMKSDMGGAAAVAQATFAAAQLGLPVRISAFLPMAENMISGDGSRPGDVITTYAGKTVELSNIDAEGRLLLVDGIARALEQEPDVVIDVATLTGHMVLALGDKVAGVMGTDAVVDAIVAAGAVSGEMHWPMPIPEEMAQRVTSSKIADLSQHDWVRWGGGLYAAAFLRAFVGETPWAHLDIAGPAFSSGAPWGHRTSGGSGWGVATLVDYLRGLSA